jgi:hypothetical protein
MPNYTGAGASQEPTIWAKLRNVVPNHEDALMVSLGPNATSQIFAMPGNVASSMPNLQWLNLRTIEA